LPRMHRILALAVAAILLTPAVAHAGALYYVDVSVRKSVVIDTKCDDGSRHFDEESDIWRASGSGRLPGKAGIAALTHMLLTAKADLPASGEPVEDVDRKMLSERDRPLSRVARFKSGRIVIDLGRFSPVKRKVSVAAPGPESDVRIREPEKEKRDKGERDANGCLPTTIRATEITGSVQRLR
jgi:hypothetical protein